MIIKILKNTTNEDNTLVNQIILANDQLLLDSNYWLKFYSYEPLLDLITNGSIVVNDGTSDLGVTAGIAWMATFGISSGNNFSYRKINNGLTIIIPEEQQMRVFQEIEIHGELECHGELIVKDN